MSTQTQKNMHLQKGFTLVEMIVAVFLFTVVMLVAVAALVAVMDANRRVQSTKVVMNNVHFALESMTRDIRTGGEYQALSETDFAFVDKDGCDVTYALVKNETSNGSTIVRSVDPGKGSCAKPQTENAPVTAPEVDVSFMGFYMGGGAQPSVKIVIRGVAGTNERSRVPFDVQTFIVQRFLERG